MPGSTTTPGRTGACDGAPVRVAFRRSDGVGTRIEFLTRLNGWPIGFPCQRFTLHLTVQHA